MACRNCQMRFVRYSYKLALRSALNVHPFQVSNLASHSVVEMYASSMRAQIDLKKNDFSYTHADICEWKEYSIVSENKLFNREEAFLSRRILVCLATIGEQFPQIWPMLFVRRCTVANDDQPKSFMELLSLTIRNFGHYVRFAISLPVYGPKCLHFSFDFHREMQRMFKVSSKVHVSS